MYNLVIKSIHNSNEGSHLQKEAIEKFFHDLIEGQETILKANTDKVIAKDAL